MNKCSVCRSAEWLMLLLLLLNQESNIKKVYILCYICNFKQKIFIFFVEIDQRKFQNQSLNKKQIFLLLLLLVWNAPLTLVCDIVNWIFFLVCLSVIIMMIITEKGENFFLFTFFWILEIFLCIFSQYFSIDKWILFFVFLINRLIDRFFFYSTKKSILIWLIWMNFLKLFS